jgi:hypothetical protein
MTRTTEEEKGRGENIFSSFATIIWNDSTPKLLWKSFILGDINQNEVKFISTIGSHVGSTWSALISNQFWYNFFDQPYQIWGYFLRSSNHILNNLKAFNLCISNDYEPNI